MSFLIFQPLIYLYKRVQDKEGKKNMEYPKSVKKFIRDQKAQIRRQFSDAKKQEELIKEMYSKLNLKKQYN